MTAQFGETLKYNGVNYYLATEPLEPYLEKHNIKFYAWCTACWRGYISKWSIEDGMLYLTDLHGFISTDDNGELINKSVGMDYLFPGQDKVLTNWFSGDLRLPHGEIIRYIHQGYDSIYEKELFLKIVNGKCAGVRETRMSSNKSWYSRLLQKLGLDRSNSSK